jgi:glycosyltransferase involved in cell wall biosynthesis
MCQTLTDIEILCVDDCSPDGSQALIDRLSREDSRISLIKHETNLGLGGARNSGIVAANSPYIASVDSDDYVAPDMLERLWNETENGAFDVVNFGYHRTDLEGNILGTIAPRARTVENCNNSIDIFKLTNPAFWNKLWRTELYKSRGIRFPIHTYYQDLATTPRVLAASRLIKFIDYSPYYYVAHRDAVTLTTSPKHLVDFISVFTILEVFLKENNLLGRYRASYREAVRSAIRYHARNVAQGEMGEDDKRAYLQSLLVIRNAILYSFPYLTTLSPDDVYLELTQSSRERNLRGIDRHGGPDDCSRCSRFNLLRRAPSHLMWAYRKLRANFFSKAR